MRRVIVFVCFVFLCSFVVGSSGVSPPSYDLDFEPNFSGDFVFDFIADDGIVSELSVIGDLAEYVTLDKTKIVGRESVVASLRLPGKVDIPGTNAIRIAAKQVSEENAGIGISAEVRGLIRIDVPYPGKYVELDLRAPDANVGEEVNLTLIANSRGQENVVAEIIVQIFKDGEKIEGFEFRPQSIVAGDSLGLSILLGTEGYVAGDYVATALAYYGEDGFSRDDNDFRLGEFRVDILNYTKDFQAGKISRMDIEVESFWNTPIDNLYAEVFVVGSQEVGFLTTTTNLKSWSKKTIQGFLDTSEIDDEVAQANVTIHYANSSTSKIVDLNIIRGIDYTIYFVVFGVLVIFGFLIWRVFLFIKKVKHHRGRLKSR